MSRQRSYRHVAALCVLGLLGCARQHTEPPAAVPHAAAPVDTFVPGGVGSLEARTPRGDTALLSLASVHIVATQRGDMAEIEATHTFHNDADTTLEGTFRFPMPDGALLTGLAMMIDGKLMEGSLVEREKARKAYEAVVDGMQDPALLEWEHGSVFKMRVFPLEAHQNKVVTMRYLAPLHRTGDTLELVQSARSASGTAALPHLSIDWQGQRVFDEKQVSADRVVTVKAKPASAVLREQRPDGAYSVVRLSPDWQRLPIPKKPTATRWFVVVDTSRSALEELPRELEALNVLLGALPPAARFQVVTSDLDAHPSPQGMVAVSPASVAAAVDFVKSITPDGASDLGRAISVVGGLAQSEPNSAVIYLGDCEPTWGVTKPQELTALLAQQLPHTPFYPLMFGSSVDDDLAADLAQASGGRRARVRRREELDAFARTLATGVPTLDGVEVKAPPGGEVLASGPLSLEEGRELLLFVKAPAGRDPLAGLTVKAKLNGAALDLMPRAPAEDAGGISKRFGAALVRKLEREGKPGPDVVQASLNYGVMSKLTSFLVLESEEAYARFAIERKQAQAAEAPRVTGANLESADGTDISADRIQPGDPEILVDAEQDALSVKVEFPFGETKTAVYDAEAHAGHGGWLVRFLVAQNTPEGEYEALAHIQHRDGTLETRRVRYVVDNSAPELQVSLKPAKNPRFTEVSVTQAGATELSDLKRVELLTPQGTTYQLVAIRWGTFRAFIPTAELRGGTLRVVGFDQALNHGVKELVLP